MHEEGWDNKETQQNLKTSEISDIEKNEETQQNLETSEISEEERVEVCKAAKRVDGANGGDCTTKRVGEERDLIHRFGSESWGFFYFFCIVFLGLSNLKILPRQTNKKKKLN